MKSPRLIGIIVTVLVIAGIGYFGWQRREQLSGLFGSQAAAAAAPHAVAGPPSQQVELTKQARLNLGLHAKPVKNQPVSWRKIEIPGVINDRPGISDRGVVAPITGVVTRVHSFPGDTVTPGSVLFSMRLVSESLHTSQMELFKATREVQMAEDQRKRLTAAAGAVTQARIIEIENQLKRQEIIVLAYRQDLQVRGLTPPQVDQIAQGKFVVEVDVHAPTRRASPDGDREIVPTSGSNDPMDSFRFEVQELKVELGQQVQAGQTMCLLSDHELLYIEGRCFQTELPLIQQATKEGWPLEVEFVDDAIKSATATTVKWPDAPWEFRIQHVANSVDPTSRTLSFFVPLTNQSQSYVHEGKRLLLWRYRPGQRVRFKVKVEKFENVFVLPAAAVVNEGPESYVFRQNGDTFDRKPVHVIFQNREEAVIANDGSVPENMYIAQTAALQLNRVLKSHTGDQPKGHYHADGSFHAAGTPEPK